MIFEFTLICFLTCLDVRGEDQPQSITRDFSDLRHCEFRDSRKTYDVTDLIQCIDKLASNVIYHEDGRAIENSFWPSFGNVVSTLFNNNPFPQYQTPSFPADTTSSYYQSNYPVISPGTFDPSMGIRVNIFDALSSISRYDDYKCVPRILCEVASGQLPGRSLGKQSYGFFENLGRNTLLEWLTNVNVIAESSPLLNFGRAVILGYNNQGNSATCYKAFPKCPRNPDDLVYYLNNYNGGLFRFFNKGNRGTYQKFKSFHQQRISNHLEGNQNSVPVFPTSQRINVHPLERYKIIVTKSPVGRVTNIFPNDARGESKKKLVFPDQDNSLRQSSKTKTSKFPGNSKATTSERNYVFFPEVDKNEEISHSRLSHHKIVFSSDASS